MREFRACRSSATRSRGGPLLSRGAVGLFVNPRHGEPEQSGRHQNAAYEKHHRNQHITDVHLPLPSSLQFMTPYFLKANTCSKAWQRHPSARLTLRPGRPEAQDCAGGPPGEDFYPCPELRKIDRQRAIVGIAAEYDVRNAAHHDQLAVR